MTTYNDNFSDKNRAGSKRPRYVVELAFDDPATDFVYLTSHVDADVPATAITNGEVIYNVVRSISGRSQSQDPQTGIATIGSFSFEVIDAGEAVTVYFRDKLDNGDGLRQKQIRLYVGFEGLAWSDYENILTYIIDGVSYQNGSYKIRCLDIQRQERKNIFAPQERNLAKTVTSTQTHIPVLTSDLTEFPVVAHDALYSVHASQSVGYAELEDELFAHVGLYNHPTDGVSFNVIQRGALNTRAAEHVLDTDADSDRALKIKEHVYLEGPAPKIIYALQTGVLYGQFDASSPPVQETLPEHWHLGIATTYVRLSDYTDIGGDFWDTDTGEGRTVRLNGPKEGDGKRFIEKELLLWLGCFQPVYPSGELGLKKLAPVLGDSGFVAVLDQSNVSKWGALTHDMKSVINQIRLDWNWHYLNDDYTKTTYLIDAESIATHSEANLKKIELFAVYTGKHTDEDLKNYFNTMRDRYAGPPLRLPVEVLPSLSWLNVGQTVRVNLEMIRDFTDPAETTLERTFEIQRTQMDWFTGRLKLELFGSSQPAGVISRTTAANVLNDAFYSSAGTELSTVLTISGGAVTDDGSLTGGALMSSAIFYYIGDLVINAGVNVNISDNVQLRVMGHLTVNGTINGKGRGLAGGSGGTLFASGGTSIAYDPDDPFLPDLSDNATAGVAGYLGTTKAAGGCYLTYQSARPYYVRPWYTEQAPALEGRVQAMPSFSLTNNGDSISGLPRNLRGTSGGGSHSVRTSRFLTPYLIKYDGGDGGDGGAGLIIISRGLSFGGAGSIDTSGNDGAVGDLGGVPFTEPPADPRYFSAGRGAGGAPGGLLVLLDGDHTPPELTDTHVALHGDSYIPPNAVFYDFSASDTVAGESATYPPYRPFRGFDMGSSAYTVQFLPEINAINEEFDPPPPDVTGFTVGVSGSTVIFKWNEVIDDNLDGYEIRYSIQTVSEWDSAKLLTAAAKGTRITDTAIPDGDWRFYIKAYDQAGQYSQIAATADQTVVSPFDAIIDRNEDPDWLGTLTNFVKHWTGRLIPQSQDSDSTAIDLSTQTIYNPFDLCSYESLELDVGFDDTVRAFQEVAGDLLPTEVGEVSIAEYMDYRLAAGSYDGYELWGVGEITARYVKFKFELDTTKGVAFIESQRTVADLLERVEQVLSFSVSASGESVTFAQAFHVIPAVEVEMVGGGAVFATASNVTTTGFDVNIYNTSGTGVAGTINWKASGV